MTHNAAADEEEDDYMSMIIQDPAPNKKESSLQRTARKKRENEARARVKSKAEREAEQKAKLEESLDTALDSSNKGFKMMAKLGFKPGMTLGKQSEEGHGAGRKEPVKVVMKEDRGGIGIDLEKKRKLKEEYEKVEKKQKISEYDYRERMRADREEQRCESMVIGAQKVAERLDGEKEESEETEAEAETESREKDGDCSAQDQLDSTSAPRRPKTKRKQKALRHIPVLYRSLARKRLEDKNKETARQLMQRSLSSRLPTYAEDPSEDADDKFARGADSGFDGFEVELEDEEDTELEEFSLLPAAERLEKLVQYLREKHCYCFWCKYQYPNAEMEGCPGQKEEDHD